MPRSSMPERHVAAEFKEIGIPDYEREQIIKAIVSLVTAVVTFAAGIAEMALGNEAAAPAVAEGAVNGVKAVATAAETAADVAKTASSLADTMGGGKVEVTAFSEKSIFLIVPVE